MKNSMDAYKTNSHYTIENLDNCLYLVVESLIEWHKGNKNTVSKRQVIEAIVNNVKGYEEFVLELGLKDIKDE